MKPEDYSLYLNDPDNAYRVFYLIAGHIRKTLAPLERDELDAWLEESERHIELFEELTDEANIQKTMNRFRTEEALKRVQQKITFVPERKKIGLRWTLLSSAAILVVLIGTAVFFILKQRKGQEQKSIVQTPLPQDIAPGGNKALLTLANGATVSLDSIVNGNIAVQGNTQVAAVNGALTYNSQQQLGIKQEPLINALSTPNGGQYKITLSDGTKVWLNAASSLRYPTAFTGKERIVELTGEGYFEVQHNPAQPFKVKVGGVVIEDLGTSFNVNSYKDDGVVKTTLIEGSIKIRDGTVSKTLKPGEEAQISGDEVKIAKADIEATTGWMHGVFVFRGTPIASVMKQIERWYGIEILNKESNHRHLVATIKKDVPLSKMLYYLEKTGDVHFDRKGKNLIVLP